MQCIIHTNLIKLFFKIKYFLNFFNKCYLHCYFNLFAFFPVGAYRIRPRIAAGANCLYGVVYRIGRIRYAPTEIIIISPYFNLNQSYFNLFL